MTMLKIVVMIFAPRLLRFWRVYLDRLNLPSHFIDVYQLYHALCESTIFFARGTVSFNWEIPRQRGCGSPCDVIR